ncbi:MAG: glycosyltransferase [Candidatus Cloacimonetes bacterium]|nr:glycosyltransferase [Candidatus Cloacimonadota bacterium]
MGKRILFIAYFYPPLGGPGVQRPVKTIKYLKEYGWEIDVLTVKDIQFHSYDFSLLSESQADKIYRTGSFDPMRIYKLLRPSNKKEILYFHTPEKIKKVIRGVFPIDDKIGWLPFAYKKALSLFKRKKYDLIFATVVPYTSALLAYKLHKKTGCPFYIDFRDHWTLLPYSLYLWKPLRRQAEVWEGKLLQAAKGVFTVGERKKTAMINRFGGYLRSKTEVVYNGFDETDFTTASIPEAPNSCLKIRYIGGFFGNRSVQNFINVLLTMKNNGELPLGATFEFVGNYFAETNKLLQNEGLAEYVKIIPQVDHRTAVKYMLSADLLLLFVSNEDGDDFVPGKLFEYIRSQKPILAMIPRQGESAQILKEIDHKYICDPKDETTIRLYLLDFFQNPAGHIFDNVAIEKYSRKNQTAKINKRLL